MSKELSILTQKITSLGEQTAAPILATDEAGVYHVAGMDELLEKIKVVTQTIEESDLAEEDRQAVRVTRKFVNDFITAVDRSVIDERARVFDPVNQERKLINERMVAMKSMLSDKLDAFDTQLRKEKRDSLIAHFNDEKLMGEHSEGLAEVTFEMVENQSWFNRSASLNKARKELSERLTSIVVVDQVQDQEGSTEEAVDILARNDWNLASTVAAIQEEKARKENERKQKEEEDRRIAELVKQAWQKGRDVALEERTVDEVDRLQGVDERNSAGDEDDECVVRKITVTVQAPRDKMEEVYGELLKTVESSVRRRSIQEDMEGTFVNIG